MQENHLAGSVASLSFCRARGADAGAYAGQKFKELHSKDGQSNTEEWLTNCKSSLRVALAAMREEGTSPAGTNAWIEGFKAEVAPVLGTYQAAAIFID